MKMFFNLAINNELFKKMIYFGSGAEFGRESWKAKMKESFFGENYPQYQYGLSKYFMNVHTRLSNNIYNLRLFGVFGERDDWRFRFIPNLCAQSSLNQNLIINQNAIFNFLYIDDLIRIVERFISTPPSSGDYNICNDINMELVEIGEIINSFDKKNKIIVKKPGITISYSGSNEKLMKTFPDLVFTPMEESIKDVYIYYKENPTIVDSSQFLIK